MKHHYLFIILFVLGINFNSDASHIAGGEITYRYIGDSTGVAHQYLVRFTAYQDMSGIPLNPTAQVNYESSCFLGGSLNLVKINSTGGSGVPIQSAYDCADLTQPGSVLFAKWVYEASIVLPGTCNDWTFYWSSCCRNPAITNIASPSGQGFVIKSFLNNNLGPNSSPVFANEAARQFCSHSPEFLVLSQQAFDTDGDSLLYYLSEPLDDPYPGVPIPWANGYSTIDPISTANGFHLNPATGVIIFKPTTVEVAVFKINVDEFRYDTITSVWQNIGSITREVQIPIVNTCNTSAINWTLQTVGSNTNKIVASCGVQELEFTTSVPVSCSSISPDGSDFIIYRSDGTLLPVVSANGVCTNDYTTTIRIQLNDTISQNDSMHIVSYVGSDFNTLVNYCGFTLPVGDSITLVVRDCPNIGLIENKIVDGIFPNPFEDNFDLRFENNSKKNVSVLSLDGQIIHQIVVREKQFRLDLSSIPSGVYLVHVQEGSDFVIRKIIKK